MLTPSFLPRRACVVRWADGNAFQGHQTGKADAAARPETRDLLPVQVIGLIGPFVGDRIEARRDGPVAV